LVFSGGCDKIPLSPPLEKGGFTISAFSVSILGRELLDQINQILPAFKSDDQQNLGGLGI
jgi:hypothetical protein